MKNRQQSAGNTVLLDPQLAGEQGFMLLGLIVTIAIILLVLSIAAADMAHTIRREREVESVRRANQYVRAIRLFYLKNGNRYPGSVKQLENTNMIRYLRQEYVDPLTGKADYRLIAVGQNKTQVTGFFGQPLAGIAGAGLGSAAGMQSAGTPGAAATTDTSGASGATGPAGATGAIGPGGAAGAAGAAGGLGLGATTGTSAASGNPFTTAPFGSSSTSGPYMGVGSSANGNSILVVNQQTTYQTWEFLYDPRIEKLKAAAALNAGASSVGAGALGSSVSGFAPGSAIGPGGTPGGANTNGGPTPNNGANPTGP